MRKLFAIILCFVLCVSLPGCSNKSNQTQIVATTLPVYEFATAICDGTGITVSQLVTENISCLHDYTLQVRQMQMLEQAEIVITSGAGLDSFVHDVLTDSAVCIDASQGIALLCSDVHHDHEPSHDHAHGEEDPHIWLSPVNAKIMANNIYASLVTAYPEHQAVFAENLQHLNCKLDALHNYGIQELNDLASRDCITFHDGFAYLADAFDLHILRAIEEESGSEASAQEIIELIALIETHNITAIFTERNSNASSPEILHRETGVSVYELDMAMSGSSYFDAMYHNINTLKEALE